MFCCCRVRKNSHESHNGTAPPAMAVNEEYMEQWNSQQRINLFLRGQHQQQQSNGASSENLYIDPDEVPENVVRLPPQPPPPPKPAAAAAAAAATGQDDHTLVYAELDQNWKGRGPPAAPDEDLPQLPPPFAAPSGGGGGQGEGEVDAQGNVIYSDIIGVLKLDQ